MLGMQPRDKVGRGLHTLAMGLYRYVTVGDHIMFIVKCKLKAKHGDLQWLRYCQCILKCVQDLGCFRGFKDN